MDILQLIVIGISLITLKGINAFAEYKINKLKEERDVKENSLKGRSIHAGGSVNIHNSLITLFPNSNEESNVRSSNK